MFINYPPKAQFFSVLGLRPSEYTQPEHQPHSDLHLATPSSFHRKPHTTSQKSSSELVLVHPEKLTVSDRSVQETVKSYCCSYEWCGKEFGRDQARRLHERTVHLHEKPFQCQICLKKFAQKGDAEKHFRVHSGAKPYFCLTCKKSFSQSSNLFTHIKGKHKIVPKKQDNWIKSWLNNSQQETHKSMFINYLPKTQFFSVFGLSPIEHTQPEHQPRSDLHQGTPSSFHHKAPTARQKSSSELVLVHPEKQTVSVRSIQETRKSYYCSYEWCGKKFQREYARRLHENSVHLHKKPFQCKICLKKFAQKYDISKHHRVHSGAKPYTCLTCKKSFSQSSNLFMHIKGKHRIAPKKQDNWIKSRLNN